MTLGKRGHERGVVLAAFAVAASVIIGGIGLCFDLGRLFIVRNEAQSFADAAALAAVAQLDGTTNGLANANAAAQRAWSGWHFGLRTFSAPTVIFYTCPLVNQKCTSDQLVVSTNAANIRYARVTTNGSNVPTYFIRLITGTTSDYVNATAVAGQLLLSGITQGLFPFMVISHNFGANFAGDCGPGTGDPHCGLIQGQEYTFRWGSNAQVDMSKYISSGGDPKHIAGWCEGDKGAFADQLAAEIQACTVCGSTYLTRSGFVEQPGNPGAGVIQDLIVDGYQNQPYFTNDWVTLWNGQIQAAISDVFLRASRDSNGGLAPPNPFNINVNAKGFPNDNITSPCYKCANHPYPGPPFTIDSNPDGMDAIKAYLRGDSARTIPAGNMWRRVFVPIVTPAAFINPNNAASRIITFFSFILYPAKYYDSMSGGNNPWCFVYEGPAEITGGSAPFDSGIYMIRLIA
jgi:Flp pilus assembly protein TadG